MAKTLRYYPDVRVTVRVGDGGQGSEDRSQGAGVRRQESGNRGQGTGSTATEVATTNASGALRIRTTGREMVRLTYDALVAVDAGVATADLTTFAVSYLGAAVDIRLIEAVAGKFKSGDSIVFYAEPYQGRYQTNNVYWFTYGGAGSAIMATRTVKPDPDAQAVTEITRTLHLENNRIYVSTIARPRDVDHWFDSQVGPYYAPISYTLDSATPC